MDRAGRLYICHWGMKRLWFPRDGKTKTCSTVTIRPAGNRLSFVACYINHSLYMPASSAVFYACMLKILHTIWAQKDVLARQKGSFLWIIEIGS
jgi:hypothetical protein